MTLLHLTVLGLLSSLHVGSIKEWRGPVNVGFGFEDDSELQFVVSRPHYNVSISSDVSKQGLSSLKWMWSESSLLDFDLRTQPVHCRRCGVQFWVYSPRELGVVLDLIVTNDRRRSFRQAYLNHTGWRSVSFWRSTGESTMLKVERLGQVSSLVIQVSRADVAQGLFYIDLVRVMEKSAGLTYDNVIPPIVNHPLGSRNELGTAEKLSGEYDFSSFWQQAYRWGRFNDRARAKQYTNKPLSAEENTAWLQVKMIKQRLNDWYLHDDQLTRITTKGSMEYAKRHLRSCGSNPANETKELPTTPLTYVSPQFLNLFPNRSSLHSVCLRTVFQRLHALTLPGHPRKRLPLFASRDVFGGPHSPFSALKVSDVINEILFPLAEEYFLLRRTNGSTLIHLQSESGTETIASSLLDTIIALFDYLNEEGWASGSGLSTMDHLMNTCGAGYSHSVYMLQEELRLRGRLDRELSTMMWYNEFGEIFWSENPYNGTTADRLKSIVFHRLMIILMMPSQRPHQIRRILDYMRSYQRALVRAVDYNEAMGGVFKPDGSGFHHKGLYMSHYVDLALGVAASLAYFLMDTQFALEPRSCSVLTGALNFYDFASVDSVVPVVGTGRFPHKRQLTMLDLLPAGAYLSNACSSSDISVGFLFMRMYANHHRKKLIGLRNINAVYWNTYGMLELVERSADRAKKAKVEPRPLLIGHRVSSYSALSIHRRQLWSVFAKGTGKYWWDFESDKLTHNLYGRYLNYGSLQISFGKNKSNMEGTRSGWDWNLIPGSTSVYLTLPELLANGLNSYSPGSLVGGLSTNIERNNGMFAMNFSTSIFPGNQGRPIAFHFQKTYIFVDDLVVCLGSRIGAVRLEGSQSIVTAVVQDKIPEGFVGWELVKQELEDGNPSLPYARSKSKLFRDTNSNCYFIPDASSLVVAVGPAKTFSQSDGSMTGRDQMFLTAYFNHSMPPTRSSYEYFVIVNCSSERFRQLQLAQPNGVALPYVILRQDSSAHVVRARSTSSVQTFYSVFDAAVIFKEGWLRSVSSPCMVITEYKNTSLLRLSVADPDLNLYDHFQSDISHLQTASVYVARSRPRRVRLLVRRTSCLITSYRSQSSMHDPRVVASTVTVRDRPLCAVDLVLRFGFKVDFDLLLGTST